MKLIEVFPLNDGIFQYFSQHDWMSNPTNLDLEYLGNKSGYKTISPLVEKLVVDNQLSIQNKMVLANTIEKIFSKKWDKLYSTLLLEYNPIDNYNMVETEKRDDYFHNDDNYETSSNISSTTTINNGGTSSYDTDNDTYGFNSSDSVNKDKNTTTRTDNLTTTNDNSDNTNIEHSSSHNGSIDVTKTLTRKGNIGVTTTQQMIESERNLWMWNIYDAIFKDIDTILTIPIYE